MTKRQLRALISCRLAQLQNYRDARREGRKVDVKRVRAVEDELNYLRGKLAGVFK